MTLHGAAGIFQICLEEERERRFHSEDQLHIINSPQNSIRLSRSYVLYNHLAELNRVYLRESSQEARKLEMSAKLSLLCLLLSLGREEKEYKVGTFPVSDPVLKVGHMLCSVDPWDYFF